MDMYAFAKPKAPFPLFHFHHNKQHRLLSILVTLRNLNVVQ